MHRTLTLAALVMIAGAGPGWAEPLPVVDIDTLCSQGFKTNPGQRDQCVRANQAAYNEIKATWGLLPDEVTQGTLAESSTFQHNDPWFYVLLFQVMERRLRTWQAEHPTPTPRFQP